jgi:hypothetical protein
MKIIKQNSLLVLLLLSCLLTNCVGNKEKNNGDADFADEKPRVSQQSKEDFGEFYPQFQEDFNLKNVRYLNKYIDEDNGLVVIASEGAYSLPHQFKNFGLFMQYQGEGEIPTIQKAKISATLQYGAKPIFDCVLQKWSHEGCYWNEKPNPQFTVLYDILMEHKVIAHDQALEEQIKTVDALATRLVYDTENNLGFYFNRMNGSWYLLCIERILPCK